MISLWSVELDHRDIFVTLVLSRKEISRGYATCLAASMCSNSRMVYIKIK